MIITVAVLWHYAAARVFRLIGACCVMAGTAYRTGAMLATYHTTTAVMIAGAVLATLGWIILTARTPATEATR